MRNKTVLIYFLLFISILASSNVPIANNGIINFQDWDFEKEGTVELNGGWEFYWDKIISPEEFQYGNPNISPNIVPIPQNWTHYKIDSKKLPQNGIATYRLSITNLSYKRYSLLINELASFNLYINGELKYCGINSDKKIVSKPLINMFSLIPEDNRLEIIIHVNNSMYFKNAGLSSSIELGLEKDIIYKKSLHLIIRAFLIGIILMAAFYNLAFFLFRKKDISFLYFSFLCIFIAIHTALMKEQLFRFLFKDISAPIYYRFLYVISFLLLPSYLSFLYSQYKTFMSKWIKNFLVYSGVLLAISAVILNTKYLLPYISPLLVYEFLVLLGIGYTMFTYLKIFNSQKEFIILELIGVLSFFSSVLIYIVLERLNYDSSFVMPFGLTVYIIFQTFLLSTNYAHSIEEKNKTLIKIDKLKDDFLAKTTHELRTPLIGIIGIAESLKEEAFGALNSKIKNNLSLIISSGRRLSNIINDILDFSKLKNQDITLNLKTVDIRTSTDIVISVLKKLIQNRKLEIINIIPANTPYVYGDEDRLLQILYNLIGNAIKFTQNGYITINAKRSGKFIEISVQDTGIGIAKDKLPTIFDSFKQAYSTDEVDDSGCGLGLSITKNLVTLHGGYIRVESNIGEGSCFYFTLPISQSGVLDKPKEQILSAILDDPDLIKENITEVEENTELVIKTENKINILVVDDEPVNLQVIRNYLATENINVYAVQEGELALEVINSRDIDIVLLDIMMPIMNGYEVCEKIRDKYTPSELPVIIITARNRISDLIKGFKSGANDYITKPFLKDELLLRVQTQLEIKKAYKTLNENLELKEEIVNRKKAEQQLINTQQKLSAMLNTVEEAVITINSQNQLSFINKSMEALSGYKAYHIEGKTFDEIFNNNDIQVLASLNDYLASNSELSKKYTKIKLQCFDGRIIEIDIVLNKITFSDESLSIIVLQPSADYNNVITQNSQTTEIAYQVIKELNKNSERIQMLEACLDKINLSEINKNPALTDYLENIDDTLKQLNCFLKTDTNDQKRDLLAVKLINLTIDYWKESTNTNKIDLARQSGLWNVYTNMDGWERTQTLDKYLSIDKFPKSPNWKRVSETVDYVLSNCENTGEKRDEISSLFKKYKKMI